MSKTSITLSDLVNAIGDEKISMQILDHCVTKFLKTKQGTKITFITDTPFDVGGTEDLGIVVWFSREDVAKFLKQREENVS